MNFNFFTNKKTSEEKFWDWFKSKSDDFFQNIETKSNELFQLLDEELHKIDKNLTYQFSPKKENGKREFIISADGLKESIPSVISLVNSAPKFKKWEVIAFRQRQQELPNIRMDDFEASPNDIFFKEEYTGKKIHITLFVRNYTTKKEYMGAIFMILDSALGEYDAMTMIDSLEVKILDEKDAMELKSIKDLPKLIDSKKKSN